jgi:hypothetical protein
MSVTLPMMTLFSYDLIEFQCFMSPDLTTVCANVGVPYEVFAKLEHSH